MDRRHFLLDTSALFSLIEDEDGADRETPRPLVVSETPVDKGWGVSTVVAGTVVMKRFQTS